ncbi:unnamed protein product [Effrenium voratum]|uniref:Uncharacterized protein n=1 Tax=Effrenium voratum TaxID=2562239 RepID=A0AA36HRP8_9DINO|nr:unnamed protein product [Effrenium voratum]
MSAGKQGMRQDAFSAFIDPALRECPNLEVVSESLCRRVLFEGGTQVAGLLDEVDIDDLEDAGENPFDSDVPWFSLWPTPSAHRSTGHSDPDRGEPKENLDLLGSCIFANRFTRLLKQEQFRTLQRSARAPRAKTPAAAKVAGGGKTSMAHKIRDKWAGVKNIEKIILNNFRDVGKGWFSIHETNQDTYRQGKLKKLLAVVKNMMQYFLEFFALDSVDDYCHGLEELCPERVEVTDLMTVQSEFEERPRPLPAKRGGSRQLLPPGRPGAAFYGVDHDDEMTDLKAGSALFLLEIKVEDKSFAYSTSSTTWRWRWSAPAGCRGGAEGFHLSGHRTDIVTNTDATVRRIFDFLGLDSNVPLPSLQSVQPEEVMETEDFTMVSENEAQDPSEEAEMLRAYAQHRLRDFARARSVRKRGVNPPLGCGFFCELEAVDVNAHMAVFL